MAVQQERPRLPAPSSSSSPQAGRVEKGEKKRILNEPSIHAVPLPSSPRWGKTENDGAPVTNSSFFERKTHGAHEVRGRVVVEWGEGGPTLSSSSVMRRGQSGVAVWVGGGGVGRGLLAVRRG